MLEYDKVTELLADCAMTEGAKQLALRLTPDSDPDRIRLKLAQTTDAREMMGRKGSPSFGSVHDVTAALERAEKGASLSTRELLDVAGVLRAARRLRDYFYDGHAPEGEGERLREIFDLLEPDRALEERITRAILAEDMIADEASPALANIRRKIRVTNNRIKDALQQYVNGSHSRELQDNIITIRNGRYVIPVKAEYKNEIKGLIHDTSASGSTMFIEPMAVVEANNDLRTLQSEEVHEIERILAELSAECAAEYDRITGDYYRITELAFIFSKAELSLRMNAAEPEINSAHLIRLHAARHPLIDRKKVVSIDISLGGGYDTLVITGPNTGGKTVSLKTLGLFALMTQAGLHIPCGPDSTMCVFDAVLADIGDEQSIEQSLSTFSAHMKTIVEICRDADRNSLVLFDELGAGTDPTEGAALAVSVIEKIRKTGALCAATTHYAEMKVFALETKGVMNASCEFDVETLKPTYRLIIGTPGKSNAFAISLKLGLDEAIVDRAKELVSADDKRFESVIEQLEKSRIEMERERDEAARLRREYETFKKEAEAKLRTKFESTERQIEQDREKAQQLLASARVSADYVMQQLEAVKKKQDSARFAEELAAARADIRRTLKEADASANPVKERRDEEYKLPRELRKGDVVELMNIGRQGVVTEKPDKNGNVTVRTGMINTRTKLNNLKLIEDAETVTADKKRVSAAAYQSMLTKSFSLSLDLRGQNGEDAWFMTDKYLDDARMAGIHEVTLIHGKGTGALRAALQKYLKGDKRVKSFRMGTYGEGDAGVTVVELR